MLLFSYKLNLDDTVSKVPQLFQSQIYGFNKTIYKHIDIFQFVQSIGYYVQYIIQLGWHTDAFEQLGKSSEASYKRFVPDGFDPPDGPEDWIDSWTLFYWGWWISWSPFVGNF